MYGLRRWKMEWLLLLLDMAWDLEILCDGAKQIARILLKEKDLEIPFFGKQLILWFFMVTFLNRLEVQQPESEPHNSFYFEINK